MWSLLGNADLSAMCDRKKERDRWMGGLFLVHLFPISSGNVDVASIGNLYLGGNVNSESTPVCESKSGRWS